MNRLLESMTGLTLLEPAWLLLALVVPAALLLRRRRGAPSVLFAPAPLLRSEGSGGRLPTSLRARLLWVPTALHVACLLVAVVALARPVRRDRLPFETEGIDVLLCLDVSSSMKTDDLGGRRTRLDVAKDAAAAFAEGRPHDRIGLVCFARYPEVRCPPTLDHEALRALLADVTTVEGDGPEDATGIGTAVARAAQLLGASEAASKVVVLLSDGAENVATAASPEEIAPLHAAQLCERLGVRVHTIAVGGDLAPPGGADARPVERLSARTGGRSFRARDAGAVAAVYAEIDALERTRFDEPRYRTEERFAPFVLASMAFLGMSVLLARTAFEALP